MRVAVMVSVASLVLGCSRAASSQASASLGYGPAGTDLANGYAEAGPPFERPAPLAWPIAQQPAHAWIAAPPVLPAAPPPVAASGDVRLLCVHVVEFLLAEAGEAGEPIDALAIADFCHIQARTEKLARSAEQWQAFLACMLDADTEAEFDACETKHPTALFEPTEHAREREACQHLVMTTLYEELGHDTNLPEGELERFRPVIRECVDELVTLERAKRSPDDYAALIECVLEQSTSAAMEACE